MHPTRVWLAALGVGVACLALGTSTSTLTASATPSTPDTVAVIGDFGSGAPAEAQVARLVTNARPRAVVTVGDNVYSSGGYAALVGRYYPTWVARHTMFPATGNHDYAEGIANFDRYFTWLGGRRTYSTTVGDLAFFVLDSQAALDSPAEMARQQAWLRAALRDAKARWRIVVLHHPPYSSGTVHGSTAAFQWPFRTWGADLVLAGHEHNYERIIRGGLTYVVDGAGGKDLYRLGRPVRGSVARDDADFGMLLLRPGAATLEGQYLTAAGRIADRFTLRR